MKLQIFNGECREAFTLLEVVVAMAIVGLGVVTLLEIFSLGLRLGSRSYARTAAVTYGRQVMDEFLVHREVPEGQAEGAFGEEYRWTLNVAPVGEEFKRLSPGAWELKEITLEMRYRDGEREKQIEMKTLRLVKKRS
ncbi:MAG: prepilin-type N-terminal cleavage/methylation domain-containing protein [Deltaproteobacteria bacterium]|nr:prepilin-type N-terminal cleavage/methylation domain-containing protein [Deltaproteobacteria bacterium]